MADHMSPLDAAFLDLEDEEPEVSMAISSVAVLEGPRFGGSRRTEGDCRSPVRCDESGMFASMDRSTDGHLRAEPRGQRSS